MRDTIFALSSGALPAAIAIIRISGPQAAATLTSLAGQLPAPRRAVSAWLRAEGETLDRALILWLPGPHNATGEDIAELHMHGSRAVAAKLLTVLGERDGLRMAEPGEFTRRAFLNGRLDLTQAEGLADLLAAETEAQRRQAMRQTEGGLGRVIEAWRERLLRCSATLEADIEFAEEEPDLDAGGRTMTLTTDLIDLASDMASALATPPAERLRDGVRVVLAGPVNAGKSSLINALSGREAAIESPVPGTTRDLIEVPVVLGGLPCLLIDSAGLRDQGGKVERLGMERTRAAIAGADLLLWLGPVEHCPDRTHAIVVQSKSDIVRNADLAADIATSTITGEGLADLRTLLEQRIGALLPASDSVVLNSRHRRHVADACGHIKGAIGQGDVLLAAEHLRLARVALDQVTGRAGVEDMLDSLFGQFCIGK